MKIIIKNYKSIINLEYKIENKIEYLVGKNESGKSNILDAILEISNQNIDKKKQNHNFEKESKISYSIIIKPKNEEFIKKINNKSNKIDFKSLIKTFFWKKWNQKSVLINLLKEEKFEIHLKNLEYFKTNIKEIFEEFKLSEINKTYYEYNDYIKNYLKFNISKNFQKDLNVFEKTIETELLFLTKIKEKKIELEKIKIKIYKYKKNELLKENYTFEEALESILFLNLWKLLGNDEKSIEILRDKEIDSDESKDERFKLEENLKIKFESFSKNFWNTNSININIKIHDNHFNISASDIFENNEKGKFRKLEKRSDGMKKYLSLLLFFEKIKKEKEKYNKIIILLDEPENYLHALAVFDLKKYIEKISNENENFCFIISTHSNYFFNFENFQNIKLVFKKTKEEGTILNDRFLFKNDKEETSGLLPLLIMNGVDKESMFNLSRGIHVFLEGIHDFYFFNSIKKYFINNNIYKNCEMKKIQFYCLGTATTNKFTLINLSISFNKKMPFFIFDHDEAGNIGFELIKNNYFKFDEKINNILFIDSTNKWKKENKNIQIQDLLKNEKDFKFQEKNTKNFLFFSNKINKDNYILDKKSIQNFKKIFIKIIENQK